MAAAAAVDPDVRLRKRRKADDTQSNGVNKRLRIFAPYRTIGLVSSSSIPFVSVPLGKTTFQLTTSIGKCLQTFDLKRGLQLVFVTSPQTPLEITATTTWEKNILAAWGSGDSSGVWIFKRGRKVAELECPYGGWKDSMRSITVFGSWIVGCCHSSIEVWKAATLQHYTSIKPASSGPGAGFSGEICTLPTYINKIFAGTENGAVEIWNISTAKLVYTLIPSSADYGSVTALACAPALSVLAVAHKSGHFVLRDVRTDCALLTFRASDDPRAAVQSISFRTDGLGAGTDGQIPGAMATASSASGDVTFWDLNRGGKKVGVLRGAHSPPSADKLVSGGISGMQFLPGQSVLVTSGLDNALKTWTFDDIPFSPIPKLLHARGGHAAAVTTLQFLPNQSDGSESIGKWLMSSSHDRSFWAWSLRRDNQSTELSQGNIRKKARKAGILNSALDVSERGTTLEELRAPRIMSIACSLNRDGGIGALAGVTSIWTNETKTKKKTNSNGFADTTGWESVVTAHEGDKFARTWFWGRKRAGRWKFKTSDAEVVTSVAISSCGTFAFVGSAGGCIDMYNLQSGIHRQRYPVRLTTALAKQARLQTSLAEINDSRQATSGEFARGFGAHTQAVTGIAVDNLNKTVVSCGLDGKVKFWHFTKGLLLDERDWSLSSLRAMRHHRASELLAIGCDDGAIRVIDIETHILVRELWTGQSACLDFVFSSDGRWILSASADSIIRVHDLSTSHLISAMRFRSQPVALAFSTTGEYLATAHADSAGINLWANRSLFTQVTTGRINEDDVTDMDAPMASGEAGEDLLVAALEEDIEAAPPSSIAASAVDQLSTDLLTLSLVPKARWQTLLHLDLIRERNRPKEAPKKPQSAPFFLPSTLSAPTQDLIKDGIVLEAASSSRISKVADPVAASSSMFTNLLQAISAAHTGSDEIDPTELIDHLSALPPSAADVAIRTIDPSPPYSEPLAFLRALTARLRQRRDYELVQTWIAVFLRSHSGLVLESDEVKAALQEWRDDSQREAKRVGDLVGYVRGVVGWVGGVV